MINSRIILIKINNMLKKVTIINSTQIINIKITISKIRSMTTSITTKMITTRIIESRMVVNMGIIREINSNTKDTVRTIITSIERE